jgi:hypothetical protein
LKYNPNNDEKKPGNERNNVLRSGRSGRRRQRRRKYHRNDEVEAMARTMKRAL